MLQDESLFAKIGFDIAENEPHKELSTRLFPLSPSRAEYSIDRAGSQLVCATLLWVRVLGPRARAPGPGEGNVLDQKNVRVWNASRA